MKCFEVHEELQKVQSEYFWDFSDTMDAADGNITDEEYERERKESISRKTVEVADKVVEKQMRIVQEIASLLGETAAETKIALAKLKESITDE